MPRKMFVAVSNFAYEDTMEMEKDAGADCDLPGADDYGLEGNRGGDRELFFGLENDIDIDGINPVILL